MGDKAEADFKSISELADQVFDGQDDADEARFKFIFERMERKGHKPRKLIEWDDADPAPKSEESSGYEGFSFRPNSSEGAKSPGPKSTGAPAAKPERPAAGMGQYS